MADTGNSSRSLSGKLFSLLLVAVVLCLGFLRFVNLDADPPRGLTRSGVLYTDEGWYARNAVSHYLGGPWIVEGDFNPIVNMPIQQFVHSGVFKLLGMSLWTSRVSGAAAFILTLFVLYLTLVGVVRKRIALAVMLLLASNYLLFAFSRIAIAENLMMLFVTSSLYFSTPSSRRGGPVAGAALAGWFFSLAVLTKLVAVFFLPVLLMLLWCPAGCITLRHHDGFARRLAACLGVVAVVFGIYFVLLVRGHMEDFRFFNQLNIAHRVKPVTLGSFLRKAFFVLKGSSLRQGGLAPIVYGGGMMGCLYVLLSRRLRREPLMTAMVVWAASYLLLAAVNGYAPPRYYVPVMIPFTVVLVSIAFWLPGTIQPRMPAFAAAVVALLVLGATVVLNTIEVAGYMRSPEYSFRDMSRDIGSRLRADEGAYAGAKAGPALLGHFANSIGLEAGLRSYNDSYKTAPIGTIVDRYDPRYYVCYGPADSIPSSDDSYESAVYLRLHYRLIFMAKYDVLGNYYKGKPVYLYRLAAK